jgi:acyl-CoA synthetase (AMP-forming)/AMP-acid ligase II
MRLIDFFDRSASRSPDRICLEDADIKRSYAEVQRRSYKLANALVIEGFSPGQKAGIYTPNCVPGMEAMLGLFRAGVAWVPVNSKNSVEDNCAFLDYGDVEILFYHSGFENSLARISELLPKVRRFICLDKPGIESLSLDDYIADAPECDPDIALGPDDLVGIAATGGTTGSPKGVMHTQRVWETMIASFYTAVEVGSDPVNLVVTPMSHGAGVLAVVLLAGGSRIILRPGFDAAEVLDTIEAEAVTHLFLPPTAIYMLLSQPGIENRRFPSLRGFLYAAAPMAVSKLEQCLEIFGPVMIQAYGQAEAPFFCTILTAEEHQVLNDPERVHRLASCGRPTMFTPLAIMDDKGTILPQGERGEIVVRGNLVMKGYYKNPEATAEASEFGWHHTGDVGLIDRDGYVYIVDRKKDMIISGGFNVYPSEIEQVIWAHPAIQDCAVIGVPDPKWGEAVKAVVELKAGASIDPEELIEICKTQLGSVKAPKSVDVWDNLPRSPVGKVLKKSVRESYWQSEARKI